MLTATEHPIRVRVRVRVMDVAGDAQGHGTPNVNPQIVGPIVATEHPYK